MHVVTKKDYFKDDLSVWGKSVTAILLLWPGYALIPGASNNDYICVVELDLRFKLNFAVLVCEVGGLRVNGRVLGCGLIDLQSRDEGPLHPASTTCGRKRGSLTGP